VNLKELEIEKERGVDPATEKIALLAKSSIWITFSCTAEGRRTDGSSSSTPVLRFAKESYMSNASEDYIV